MTIRNLLVVATVTATCVNALEAAAAASGDVVKNDKAGEATVNMLGEGSWSSEMENQTEGMDLDALVQSAFNYSGGEPLSPPIELTAATKKADQEQDSSDQLPDIIDGSDFGEPQLADESKIEEKFRHFFDKGAVLAVLERTRAYMQGLGELTEEQAEYCYNFESDCSFWAANGECVKNPDYMQYDCAPACQSCEAVWEEVATGDGEKAQLEGHGGNYGVVQIVDPSLVEESEIDAATVLQKLSEIDEYMSSQTDSCVNYFAMCTIWSVKGWCESNSELMHEDCMPACKVCHLDDDEEEEEMVAGEEFGVKQVLHPSDISEKFRHLFDQKLVREYLESTKEYMSSLQLSEENSLDCQNEDSLCTWSATVGECIKNPDYMLYSCAPACKSCDKLMEDEEEGVQGPGSEYGVVQIMDPASVLEHSVDQAAVAAKLKETEEYMASQDSESCYNVYAMCTIFAAQGLCETDVEMMSFGCPPACKACGADQNSPEAIEMLHDRTMSTELGPGEEFGVEQILSKEDLVPQFQHLFDEVAVQKHLQDTKAYLESLSDEEAVGCFNQDSFCTFSAVTGECEMNPDYMLYECAPACRSCHKLSEEAPEPEGPGSTYGVVQIADPSKLEGETLEAAAVLKKLEEVDEYMRDKDTKTCVNVYAMCTLWAIQGWCQSEAELMDYDCPAACMNCDNERLAGYLSENDAINPGEEFGVEQMVDANEMVEEYRHLFDEAAIRRLLDETKTYMDSLDLTEQEAQQCFNNDPLCTFSAITGECVKNPDYMLYECAPACKSCDKLLEEEQAEPEGPGFRYGVNQITDPFSVGETDVEPEAVLQKLAEVGRYMDGLQDHFVECTNVYAMCTIFAVKGMCEGEPAMMLEDCAPACLSCNEEAN